MPWQAGPALAEPLNRSGAPQEARDASAGARSDGPIAPIAVWLLKDGETLPIEPGARRMRTGMLAAELVQRGHRVVWWSSTFSHQRKRFTSHRDGAVAVDAGLTIQLVHAGAYRRNLSVRRWLHHQKLAWRFASLARSLPPPDVIVAALPITVLAYKAIRYARERNIPVIIDVRDPWPDNLVIKCPRGLQTVIRWLLLLEYRQTSKVLQSATSVVAISKGCLAWAAKRAARPLQSAGKVFYTGYPSAASALPAASALDSLRARLSGKVVFLFIGTFGITYELDVVCEAAEQLLEMSATNIHFVLVGDGDRFETISRRAATLPNVTLTGWLGQDDLISALQLADVGLVPVRAVKDAMPNKAFEYLAAGLPLLSSLQGEMEGVIARHGIGCSYAPGDADALRERIMELAADPSRRAAMRRESTALFAREFSADSIYKVYARHVEHVASGVIDSEAPVDAANLPAAGDVVWD